MGICQVFRQLLEGDFINLYFFSKSLGDKYPMEEWILNEL